MLQRIQTVYLTAVIIACVMLFTFPLATYDNAAKGTYELSITGCRYMTNPPIYVEFWRTFPMLLIVISSLVLAVISLLLYKKRRIQVLLVNITFLLHVILIGIIYIYYSSHFVTMANAQPSYKFGIFLPLISLVLLVLASRAIRKDEALVRSADRLRQ
jgi:hypothetical protein